MTLRACAFVTTTSPPTVCPDGPGWSVSAGPATFHLADTPALRALVDACLAALSGTTEPGQPPAERFGVHIPAGSS